MSSPRRPIWNLPADLGARGFQTLGHIVRVGGRGAPSEIEPSPGHGDGHQHVGHEHRKSEALGSDRRPELAEANQGQCRPAHRDDHNMQGEGPSAEAALERGPFLGASDRTRVRDRMKPTLVTTRWTPSPSVRARARQSLRAPTGRPSMKTRTFGQANPVPTSLITTLGWPDGSLTKADPPGSRFPLTKGLFT